MRLAEFYAGAKFRVVQYQAPSGNRPVSDFLGGLQRPDQNKMVALIRAAANAGPPRNIEKCRKVAGQDFWEFKTHGQRVFWAYHGAGLMVLLHGFTKRDESTPRREIEVGAERYAELKRNSE